MRTKSFSIATSVVILFFSSFNILSPDKNDNAKFLTLSFSEITVGAQTGTCCPEKGSYCIVGTHYHPDHFYLTSGSCNGQHLIE